jgi:tetratricopeptide (TPR) repeat protein
MMSNTPADGWDDDEREAMKGLAHELDSLRARHARDPQVELLRAADAEALPDELQSAGTTYLASNRWGRALVDGLNDANPLLEPQDESRLLDRIRREAGASTRPRASWSWMWPSFAAVAAGIIAVVWVMRPGVTPEVSPTTERPVVVNTPPAAPVFALALEKPEVKLSVGTLTWRGSSGTGDLVADLKPGLDAYRADDFATARRELGALTARYPNAVEVFLYLGIAQLHVGEYQAAVDSLTNALRLSNTADAWFGAESAWQRAIAEERIGQKNGARATLTELCKGNSPRAQAACAAAASIK